MHVRTYVHVQAVDVELWASSRTDVKFIQRSSGDMHMVAEMRVRLCTCLLGLPAFATVRMSACLHAVYKGQHCVHCRAPTPRQPWPLTHRKQPQGRTPLLLTVPYTSVAFVYPSPAEARHPPPGARPWPRPPRLGLR